MSLAKCASKAPADVFHAFLVEKADYDGIEEIPCIKTSRLLPARDYSLFKKRYSQLILTNGSCSMNTTANLCGYGITPEST